MVKKLVLVLSVIVLTLGVFTVTASADYSGTTDVYVRYSNDKGNWYGSYTNPTIPAVGYTWNTPSYMYYNVTSATLPNTVSFDTTVGMYLSYYFRSQPYYSWTYDPTLVSSSSYQGTYLNSAGSQGTVPSVDVSTFEPAYSSSYSNSIGITLKTDFAGSPELPISRLGVFCNNNSATFNCNAGVPCTFVISSFKLVETADQGTLNALESMADAIVAQNDILSAMYGDVMEVLNAIYSRLGDMHATMNVANTYFGYMIGYLGSIDTNTANIYSLLQAQFQLLIATINTASSDIQDAIQEQTNDMIAYFDSVFNSAVGSLPDDNESTQGVIDNAHENEEEYTADALGKFQEINATFNGFNGSVGSGVAVASTLFSRVWSAMGDYVIVYTFPLMLALSLVVVGRSSRVHSNGSSNKGKGGEDNG